MKKIINAIPAIILTAALVVGGLMSAGYFIEGNLLEGARFAIIPVVILIAKGYFKRRGYAMAVVSTLNRFNAAVDNNSFNGQGIKAYTQAYAATSAWVAVAAQLQHVCYAQLTGAMTINATVTSMLQFSEVVFFFDTDGTQRVVTFGTNFLSSGTVTIPANKGAIVKGVFDGTNIRILSREIYA